MIILFWDIDGTLLKWVDGVGATYEEISPAVHESVHRAIAAGAHIVLSSGRSPHGMTPVADLLELPQSTVSSNLQILEEAGVIKTETQKARKGNQKICRAVFDEVKVKRPKGTRAGSKETYVVGRGRKR